MYELMCTHESMKAQQSVAFGDVCSRITTGNVRGHAYLSR